MVGGGHDLIQVEEEISYGVHNSKYQRARAPPEFGGSERRTEREIDNQLLQAPLDLKSYPRLCYLKTFC